MEEWTKYLYLCTDCDALIEITASVEPQADPSCICHETAVVIGIGQEDATYREDDVTNITPTEVVKINTNPYN